MRSIGLPELIVLAIIVTAVVMLVKGIRDFLRAGTGGFSVVWSGGVVGGIVGFLLRPSVPLVGQLPLEAVLTRGGSLNGLDVLLKGAAETSFNYMVAGVLIGCLGAIIFVKRSSHGSAASKEVAVPSHSPLSIDSNPPTQASSSDGFCIKCGKALPTAADFCGGCGAQRASA